MSVVLLTTSAGLNVTYGFNGAAQVIGKIANYTAAVPGSSLAVLDDPVSMRPFGGPALSLERAALRVAIGNVLRGLGQGLKLLIVGGDSVLPYWSVPNPVTDRSIDPDPFVLTDNPYGMALDASPDPGLAFTPPIAIGRVCTGSGDTAASMCTLIDNMIVNHTHRVVRGGYVEITNRAWINSSAFVTSALAGPGRVLICPNDAVTAANTSVLDCSTVYCNLHGFSNGSSWNGSDPVRGFVPAVTPDSFDARFVSGSFVYTEACYGVQTVGRPTSGSCALKLLQCGAAAVFGSTGLAFGSATEQPQDLLDADALTRAFFELAEGGATIGDSVVGARQEFADGGLDGYRMKTLLQFQILGDPTLVAI